MRKGISLAALWLAVSMAYAQEEYAYVPIMTFEELEPPRISAAWQFFTDFELGEGAVVYEGETSLILIIDGGTSPWVFSTWEFPAEVGTLDLSHTDEFQIWVNADNIFQMNFEFGGANLGYRYYREEDIGTWKKLVWWYTEETAAGFTEVNSWGSFINPEAFSGFPAGFVGTIYIDAISARVRQYSPEREYLLLNGFNNESDLEGVTLNPDYAIGIKKGGEVAASEGDGFLAFTLSDTGANRFSIDLTNVPEFMHYDRLHFDMYVDGAATGGWGNFELFVDVSMPDAEGNLQTTTTTLLQGSYYIAATERWFSFGAQYGPVPDTEGFLLQHFKQNVAAPVYTTEGATMQIRLSSNGGGVEEIPMYIDNLRLSRPAGTPVAAWELY
ncbi:MAG TPA: hypothetical protein PK878_13745 [bacterium]|nr:hypothetical protein [bacterium]HPO99642.1 hypothetical protein [bacterium]HXK94556.1 hypothetical protein [bacterium]